MNRFIILNFQKEKSATFENGGYNFGTNGDQGQELLFVIVPKVQVSRKQISLLFFAQF